MHPVRNLVILYTLYDHLVTKRSTLSALRTLHLHRQLRLGERIRFRHRGTFQQVSTTTTFKITITNDVLHHRLHQNNDIVTTTPRHSMLVYKIPAGHCIAPRYTSLDRRRDERNSPPKSPPPFSKAESRFEREQRIKVKIQGFSNF